jgi:hypothetical protein
MSAPGRVPGFGAGYVAGEGDLPAVALPAVVREGRRVFWPLCFACRCAIIRVMERGSIVCTLPEEKRALAGKGVLLQWAVAPNMRFHADGFAASRLAAGEAQAVGWLTGAFWRKIVTTYPASKETG